MLLTFLVVLVGWVFFRAQTFAGAMAILAAMVGVNGALLPNAIAIHGGPLAGWLA